MIGSIDHGKTTMTAAAILPFLLLSTGMGIPGLGLPSFGGSRSAASIRHDPRRPKTDADLERMAAAQRKRDRKAARKGPPNANCPSVGATDKDHEPRTNSPGVG